MAKAKAKTQKKPAAKAKKSKPIAKKTSKPAKKAVKKVVAKAKPAAKKVVKKSAPKKVVNKPAAKAKAKPVVKKVVKAAKPVSKKPEAKNIKPVVKPSKKSAVKTTSQPAVREVRKVYVAEAARPQTNTTKKGKLKMLDLDLRYSDKELKEFKDLIDKKLADAREELKNLKESLDNHTESQAGNKAWNMEEGTDTTEMEYLMNQISRQHQYIRNLELALIRIENKTYGICRVTGKLIPKERLRVVPHATLSLEAKMTRKSTDEEIAPAAAVNAPPSDFAEGFED